MFSHFLSGGSHNVLGLVRNEGPYLQKGFPRKEDPTPAKFGDGTFPPLLAKFGYGTPSLGQEGLRRPLSV